ncbi:MAG TPA: hypothetical protein VH186_00245 [Chloroflexia bacterium]|nr:hypothetical protein [Chloroflexia bacterium]
MPGYILRSRGRRLAASIALLLLLTSFLACFSGTARAENEKLYTITEYGWLDHFSPENITAGQDGKMWFTLRYGGMIGIMSSTGQLNVFKLPNSWSYPIDITAGPGRSLWFTESGNNKIGKLTTDGYLTEYPVPTQYGYPYGITTGPDGNVWFTEGPSSKIGKITHAGVITEYPLPANSYWPFDITKGPDGNLWFTESSWIGKIGKITTDGIITEYVLPQNTLPENITAGPDGNLWFTVPNGNKIGKITVSGTVTMYSLTLGYDPSGITSGPDGNIWFTESGGNKLGMITTDGTITEFPLPNLNTWPGGIAAGPDGYVWFTEGGIQRIGKIYVGEKLIPEILTADLIPTLTLTPDRTASPSPDTVITLNLKLKNLGPGKAGFLALEIPFDPRLTLGHAVMDYPGLWVSQVDGTTIKIGLETLPSGDSATGSLVFRPNPANPPQNGTEISFRFKVSYADQAGVQSRTSNKVTLSFGESSRDATGGKVRQLPPRKAKVGDKKVIWSDHFLPGERVSLWYTAPDGANVSLPYAWADDNGKMETIFDTTGLKPGVYSFVGQGNRSEVQVYTLVTLTE